MHKKIIITAILTTLSGCVTTGTNNPTSQAKPVKSTNTYGFDLRSESHVNIEKALISTWLNQAKGDDELFTNGMRYFSDLRRDYNLKRSSGISAQEAKAPALEVIKLRVAEGNRLLAGRDFIVAFKPKNIELTVNDINPEKSTISIQNYFFSGNVFNKWIKYEDNAKNSNQKQYGSPGSIDNNPVASQLVWGVSRVNYPWAFLERTYDKSTLSNLYYSIKKSNRKLIAKTEGGYLKLSNPVCGIDNKNNGISSYMEGGLNSYNFVCKFDIAESKLEGWGVVGLDK